MVSLSSENATSFEERDIPLLQTREGKSKEACKEVKYCELVEYHSLPDYLKDNEFILSYYRCEWPLKETILSLFSIHNETLNIWTHLIGFFIFLALTTYTGSMAWMGYNVSSEQQSPLELDLHQEVSDCTERISMTNYSTDACALLQASLVHGAATIITSPITRWPLYAFLCGAMLCLLASSACHLLACHSKRCSYFMLRLDYTGISALIVTSFYPLVYYSFMCDHFFRNLYIIFITVFGVAIALVCLLPVFQTSAFRPIRSGLFLCMGISGLVPVTHKLITFNHRPEALITTSYELVMGAFYVIGVAVYVTRVPERWMPGKFDLAGHSHQLFHVLVIAGAYTHYVAGLVYLKWRDLEGC